MIIDCPSCRGQGHVEGYPCSCKGWGRLKVKVVGPVNHRGEVQTKPIDEAITGKDIHDALNRRRG